MMGYDSTRFSGDQPGSCYVLAMLYSTTSPDHSGSVTFVVRPSTTSLRPATAALQYVTLMTRSLPSTEDLWRFSTFPGNPDRRGRPFPICHALLRSVTSTHDCHRVLTTASLRRAVLLRSHYEHTRSMGTAHVRSRPF